MADEEHVPQRFLAKLLTLIQKYIYIWLWLCAAKKDSSSKKEFLKSFTNSYGRA